MYDVDGHNVKVSRKLPPGLSAEPMSLYKSYLGFVLGMTLRACEQAGVLDTLLPPAPPTSTMTSAPSDLDDQNSEYMEDDDPADDRDYNTGGSFGAGPPNAPHGWSTYGNTTGRLPNFPGQPSAPLTPPKEGSGKGQPSVAGMGTHVGCGNLVQGISDLRHLPLSPLSSPPPAKRPQQVSHDR